MKIAFISDIHGNALALDNVLADIQQKKMDKIYVLGDLCYRGPEPKRSLELVRALQTEVIKGNADEWVVRGVREGEVPDKVLELMNRERDWTLSRLDPADVDYLRRLPAELNLQVEGVSIHAFHATPQSLFEVVVPYAEDESMLVKQMSAKDAKIYIYAHIHKPFVRYIHGKIIMNTGSVGLPFDGLAMASYATIEIADGNIKTSIERVRYDVEKAAEKYREAEYPNADMMINILKNAKV